MNSTKPGQFIGVRWWAAFMILFLLAMTRESPGAPNEKLAETAFHEAAGLFVKQQDEKALEKVQEALGLEPENASARRLKELIEASMQQESDSEQESGDQSGESGAEPEDAKDGESEGDSERDEADDGSSGDEKSSENEPPQDQHDSEAPDDRRENSEQSGEENPSSPGSEGSEASADGGNAGEDPASVMNPSQVQALLDSLEEDELSQLRARPVKLFGEQESDEDW